MSQLLARLQKDLHSTSDAVLRAEITARIACNLARSGMFDEARSAIADLRQAFGDGRSGRATVWIMLAEGLVHLFSALSPEALDRITRAQVLGLAMRYPEFVGVASAWKAHIEFETSKFESMLTSLSVAISNAADADHDAQTRIAMVICNSFMICGDRKSAQHWFLQGRDHALKNGDQASVEAMVYNRAVFNFSRLRVQACKGLIPVPELKAIRMEIESARNFQDLTKSASISHHIHFCEARLFIIEGEYEKAMKKFHSVRNQLPFAAYNFDQAFVDLEICYCLAKATSTENALALHSTVGSFDFSALDVDEQLVACWIRWKLCELDCRFGSVKVYREQFDELLWQYEDSRHSLSLGLAAFVRS